MSKVTVLHFTGQPDADRFLATEPLALLVGMLLDQQVPMERAFLAPYLLRERLGGHLDAGRIAAMEPDELAGVFSQKPALHRFPGNMARRVHELCRAVADEYGGRAERIWEGVGAAELYRRLRALPGFGEEKARIFVTVLARRLGVAPEGWEAYAIDRPSVADVASPGDIARVREAKRAWKAGATKA